MSVQQPTVRQSETAAPSVRVNDLAARPVPVRTWARPSTPTGPAPSVEEIVRPATGARPARRPAARPNRHLVAFAFAVPASGSAGVIVGLLDTVSTAAAVILPVAVFTGVMVARVLLARLWAWVRALAAVVAGWCR